MSDKEKWSEIEEFLETTIVEEDSLTYIPPTRDTSAERLVKVSFNDAIFTSYNDDPLRESYESQIRAEVNQLHSRIIDCRFGIQRIEKYLNAERTRLAMHEERLTDLLDHFDPNIEELAPFVGSRQKAFIRLRKQSGKAPLTCIEGLGRVMRGRLKSDYGIDNVASLACLVIRVNIGATDRPKGIGAVKFLELTMHLLDFFERNPTQRPTKEDDYTDKAMDFDAIKDYVTTLGVDTSERNLGKTSKAMVSANQKRRKLIHDSHNYFQDEDNFLAYSPKRRSPWEKGNDACRQNEPFTECKYKTADNIDDWMAGWIAGKRKVWEFYGKHT